VNGIDVLRREILARIVSSDLGYMLRGLRRDEMMGTAQLDGSRMEDCVVWLYDQIQILPRFALWFCGNIRRGSGSQGALAAS
jgi:hypothetical protein